MSFLNDPLFKALFFTDTPRIILKADAPNFTILTYNDAYMRATYTHYRNIVGWYLWEAFDPKNACSDNDKFLLDALTRAAVNNETIVTPPFHYNIPSANPGEMMESWWQLDIIPVLGRSEKPAYLLVTTNNITGKILNQ
ncbi:hypothetical protein [Mucilaginibacter sp. FT3.2]|uniref:hypothetical protein n=1 Tax=Mucilaginibacter sp. FT3.2 TaxID=2723090 RepID=UPI00160835E8|nr:hypothetical protein [Mucilaginibacter sp. FT3.2]MBB6230871.1 hypothetical protein [Mucilaginibacter sp. FT3.2]